MSKQDMHRRSYGYVSHDEEPDEPKSKAPERKRKKKKRKSDVQRPAFFKHLLLAPFRLIIWLVVGSWHVMQALWKRLFGGKKKKKYSRKSIMGFLFKWGLLAFVLGVISLVIIVAWASRDLPDPNKLTDRQIDQSTKIYDRTGEQLLYEIFAEEKRTLVTLDKIPDHLKNGLIATEDKIFYEHRGIRPLSILRAVVYGFLPGRRVAGTSTLTQQLVKNAILTNERSITRKIKEAILSIRLEQKYTKDQILQVYFNEIPYGSTNYGAQAAAQSYFGKDVWELDLQESATLAGLPKAPSTYLTNPEALKQRRDFVLARMFVEGYITEDEKNAAQSSSTTLSQEYGNIRAPHFSLHVRDLLTTDLEIDEKTVDSGGLKVITTLDWEKQQLAEQIVDEVGTEVLAAAEANNTSLVSIDPKTGHVLTMIGSKDFYDDDIAGKFNVATLGKRQPGSSFKPIVYTAAFELGYTPETVLFDVITDFGNYKPLNYDLSEHGPVTMRQALQGSLNIPAVKALYLVGVPETIDFVKRLGYTTLGEGDFGLSLVLGGGEVKLIDHVAAYASLANHGTHHKPVHILRVEDKDGEVLHEWKQEKGKKVLDSDITATISNVLSDDGARAYAFGTGSVLTLPGRPVAAKTGTTNNYIDGWTIGYTPSLVTGVWAGNTDNTPMKRGFGGSKVAGPIWNKFMQEALRDTAVEGFPAPPENDAEKAVLRGSAGGGITLKVDKVTGKLASTSTPENLIVERTYIPAHSILHYVTKRDPRGPIPEDPGADPKYGVFEQAIQDWITKKKEEDPDWDVSFEDPPTEYDDIHSLEQIPTLEIIYPAPSGTISSRQIDTDIRVSAQRGVSKVTYRLDGKYVGVVRNHPFNLNYFAAGMDPGVHTLTIIVEDDVSNRLEQDVRFTFSGETVKPGVSWIGGAQTITTGQFPYQLLLKHTKLNEIERVVITARNQADATDTMTVTTIEEFSNLFNGQIVVQWQDAPEAGTWTLRADVKTKDGGAGTGGSVGITIQ